MSSGEFLNSGNQHSVAHRILLVEDDPEVSAFIKELLEENNYKVMLAKDGGQAQATFTMQKPDFVILDLILPGESGFEICKRFKQMNEQIPILILSAIELPDSKRLAEKVGADGYLTKPFDSEELLHQISTISELAWKRKHTEQPGEVGRIKFHCLCGKRFAVSPAHRGKNLICPQCGEPVAVPRHGN
ncbi:hypothetical protein MNBD_PLANCTO02-1141 [hydrothermal vent metagenome]|uniref:Response regulatory domain-containing protein n=1 Tax=hydrothermal vent metagenome TaxID=652676 RepID=A0A3B1DN22_9ZZZZ